MAVITPGFIWKLFWPSDDGRPKLEMIERVGRVYDLIRSAQQKAR